MTMPRTAGFPIASKRVFQSEQARSHRAHRDKLLSVQASVDNGPMHQRTAYPHIFLNYKKMEQEEQHLAIVELRNGQLVERMARIMLDGSHIDTGSRKQHTINSLNTLVRKHKFEEVSRNNAVLAQRLNTIRPHYEVKVWHEEYKRHENYMRLQDEVTKDFKVLNKSVIKKNFKNTMESTADSQETNETTQPEQHEESGKSKNQPPATKQVDTTPYTGPDPKNLANQNQIEMDARLLFKACKQFVEADDAFIKTLIKRSPAQRQQIKDKFDELYSLVLVTELKKGLGSSWHPLIMVLFTNRDSVHSDICHTALQRGECLAMIEILANKDNQSIMKLQQIYSKEHKNTPLETDIMNDLKEPVQTLILKLCKGTRDETTDVDVKQAESDAQQFLQLDEDGWTSDTGLFMRLVEEKSFAQLRATMIAYKQITVGKDISEAVSKITHDNTYVKAIAKFVTCICQSSSLSAEKIHKHLHPEDPVLLDILIYKSQADIAHIKMAYKKLYCEDLLDHLKERGNHATYRVLYEIISKAVVDTNKTKSPGPTKTLSKKGSVLTPAPSKQRIFVKKSKLGKQKAVPDKPAVNKTSIERNSASAQSNASKPSSTPDQLRSDNDATV